MKNETIIRITGIFSIIAGLLYILIQFIHPEDNIDSVGTTIWMLVAILTSIMSLCFIIGILGLFSKNVKKSGVFGIVGLILFSSFWVISMIFSFNEAFILPLLKTSSPQFVKGITGLFSGYNSSVSLGIFPILTTISGILYILGGIVFGLSLLRGKLLQKYFAIILVLSSIVTVGASIVPHPFDRIFAIPMGISFILLGYFVFMDDYSY